MCNSSLMVTRSICNLGGKTRVRVPVPFLIADLYTTINYLTAHTGRCKDEINECQQGFGHIKKQLMANENLAEYI